MNLMTVPIDRVATNVALEAESAFGRPSVVPNLVTAGAERVETTVSSTDFFRWTEFLRKDLIYAYDARDPEVEPANFKTWVVRTVFTPPTESHFRNMILQARLPAKLIFEGVAPPTTECRVQAYEIWKCLYKRFALLPVRVSASVECGITLSYHHATNGRILVVEVYNDLEVAASISDRGAILYSEDVKGLDFDNIFLRFNV
jgi:hypothetical protein